MTATAALSGELPDTPPFAGQRPLKLAIYYPWLYLKSGGERTILELVSRSRHEWTIFTNRYESESTYPGLRNVPIVQLDCVSVKRSFREVIASAFRILTQKLPLDGYDALLVFCEGLGDLVVFRNCGKIPLACYCFTPLRAAFDDSYQSHYLAMKGNSRLRRIALSAGAAVFRTIDRIAWKRYAHVFVISNEVKRRILNGKLCPAEKMSLLYAGIDFSALQSTGRYDPYFLIPGRIMWTKNTMLGLCAFIQFKAANPAFASFRLVIAGFVDKKSQSYLAGLREIATGREDVDFCIEPDDAELFDLYKHCYSVIYTPFNEDMGLIPVEAMAAGKPVLTVNCGGPRETVTHGRNGFLLEQVQEDFVQAMGTLAANPEMVRTMGAAGREDARSFDWSYFHQAVDGYFDELVMSNRDAKTKRGV